MGQLRLRHRCVSGIVQRGDAATVVVIPDGAEKDRNRSNPIRCDLGDERGRIEDTRNDGGAFHPPATGGIRAISSPPPMSLSEDASRLLTATTRDGGNEAAAGSDWIRRTRSPTVLPWSSAISS